MYLNPGEPIGTVADHWDYRADDDDYYTQPGTLFRMMPPDQRRALFANTARAIAGVPDEIQQRHINNCGYADPAYGYGVEAAIARLK